ncbi:MAG: hypothetical protein ABI281_08235 [Caldimonas sp.]
MRMIFGVLSLLIALAIVGSLVKKNLQAVGGSSIASRQAQAASQAAAMAADPGSRDGATLSIPGGMPSAVAADVNGLTVPQQSKALQDKVRDDTVRALQQGADRSRQAADQN